MSKVKVGSDDFSEDLLFIWPVTIIHVIDQDSPFYTMDAASMLNEKYVLNPFHIQMYISNEI